MLARGFLDGDGAHVVHQAIDILLARGLGLEPNLMARTAARLTEDVRAAGAVAAALAGCDSDFANFVRRADSCRDNRDWAGAESYYWQALTLFPTHAGILTQNAHCLKDQDRFLEAFVRYWDALAYGAPPADVLEHLCFVVDRIPRVSGQRARLEAKAADKSPTTRRPALDRALISEDVVALTLLFHGRRPEMEDVVISLTRYSTRRELIGSLMAHESFGQTHRDLLQLLAERQHDT